MVDPVDALLEAARARPEAPEGWRALGDALHRAGRLGEAGAAYEQAMLVGVHDPALRQAALALAANRLDVAERLLKPHLRSHPTDTAAMRMLAELAARLGRLDDAGALLDRALELAPNFLAARQNRAMLHLRQHRAAEAMQEIETLLAAEPDNPAFLNLQGVALARIGDYGDAAERFAAVLAARPAQPRVWLSYGHALKTIGRREDSIEAYRRAIALQPGLGEAWWSLANLKSLRFDAEDVAVMRRAAEGRLAEDDALHLHFALGKALEDAGDPAAAFDHYARANAIRAEQLAYDPAPVEALVDAVVERCDAQFFESRAGQGDPAPDPIFVLGMPRSGSTLVEQILASHTMVEGTRELPDIEMLARSLGPLDGRHIAALAAAPPERLAAMGRAFIANTRVHRKTGAPLFIDKMPNNWAFIPLIRLILPRARIIDTRRGAMACCFSNFKQHYARGQAFSYRLDHMARYYRAYVRAMDHFDAVMPGAIVRVHHEAMVEDSESAIRGLLAGLDLPFEERCLRFWETERAVQTASSEQVRRPIFRDGVDQWQGFAPWLGALRDGLGALAV